MLLRTINANWPLIPRKRSMPRSLSACIYVWVITIMFGWALCPCPASLEPHGAGWHQTHIPLMACPPPRSSISWCQMSWDRKDLSPRCIKVSSGPRPQPGQFSCLRKPTGPPREKFTAYPAQSHQAPYTAILSTLTPT